MTQYITMMRYHFYLLILFSSLAQAAPNVVVSIKPVHSLVSGLMQGVATPKLLMQSPQSPHHYSLKPSDRRLLDRADLIFWVGPELESFMPRLLENLDSKTQSISLMENKNLKKLPLRQIHADHDHKQSPLNKHIWDSHIWLNTHNADILVDEIAQQLIKTDPDNTQQYKNNQQQLHKKINILREELYLSLSKISRPFLSYHDSYQYFENEFKLNNKGFVTGNTDASPGIRKILELKQTIKNNSIQCLFYDTPRKHNVIDTLISNNNIKAIELDPTGMHLKEGEQAWFIIMRTLGNNFKNCLQSG